MTHSRRTFLHTASLGLATTGLSNDAPEHAEAALPFPDQTQGATAEHDTGIQFPRVFTGRQLKMIAFPLGGVGAGSISLGGRGQLRDWEIFNRADKGNQLLYALPSVWVQVGNAKPMVRVLEGRYAPPYEGQDGLGSENAPGLTRIASTRFTGEYPFARIDFEDSSLPVRISLEAFTPFIPHDGDSSGLPIAILRYRIENPEPQPARVSVAWSIDNPVAPGETSSFSSEMRATRMNEFRTSKTVSGLLMTNPGLPATDLFHGSFALGIMHHEGGKLTWLRGWPKGAWWNSPLLFWDDFSSDGELGPEPAALSAVGALCLSRRIPGADSAIFEFLLAWHFANRTPARCGWQAPKNEENTVIGNWYATRFSDAWDVAQYTAVHLPDLEAKSRLFSASLRESTLPAEVREAASANLSTLATPTCFRTADGEFHGFEGVDDKSGCCFGNCTHVWNYETATAYLFPTFARSLRKASFGYSMDEAGAMHFRQLLPDGKERSHSAAADGQMGQIVHAYLDWCLSGDLGWLQDLWPCIKKAMQFAWVPGGWDENRDGVMEGVQHNTYDVEFYGPNPMCGIYYLAALRACDKMAHAVGEIEFASECHQLFESGSRWFDENLFNGEFYIQHIRGYSNDQIAASLRSSMGTDNPEHPDYQVGAGCLIDQLVGQYLADVCGLGDLLKPENIRKTLKSIYTYNYKRTLYNHDSVQRTYVLNDESALVICDYAKAERPRIPFPYFAESWTGLEYTAASGMLYAGMLDEGLECIRSVRSRYDGERRNPWDEAECGHHYARAMAAWSGVLALSGLHYFGSEHHLSFIPKTSLSDFRCFWSNGTGWGVLTRTQGPPLKVRVILHSGALLLRSLEAEASGIDSNLAAGRVTHGSRSLPHRLEHREQRIVFRLDHQLLLNEGETAVFSVEP